MSDQHAPGVRLSTQLLPDEHIWHSCYEVIAPIREVITLICRLKQKNYRLCVSQLREYLPTIKKGEQRELAEHKILFLVRASAHLMLSQPDYQFQDIYTYNVGISETPTRKLKPASFILFFLSHSWCLWCWADVVSTVRRTVSQLVFCSCNR